MDVTAHSPDPAGSRIVVAMSGGVDSSVAAALLKEQGYDVVGITLQLYDHGAAAKRSRACCAGQDIHDARRVAEAIGIPHYVLDYERRFHAEVIEPFAESYARGFTPVPCIACNRTVKFRDLMAMAQDLGAAALATGHYARRVAGPAGPELHRGADPARDQSYFLFATTARQLDFLRFPLGHMPKDETRALATRLGLPVAAKPDSQDICFVPDGDYAAVVARLRPEAAQPGDIVDLSGRVLGRHAGTIRFTVGQRRGLDIGGTAEPLYVVHIEPDKRRVVVGPRDALAVHRLHLSGFNWLGGAEPAAAVECEIKIRNAMPPVAATVRRLTSDSAEVDFAAPAFGVAPGQACVLYAGARVLGGGWIERPAKRAA
jgi:tRNA-specific 2-thiouridylase